MRQLFFFAFSLILLNQVRSWAAVDLSLLPDLDSSKRQQTHTDRLREYLPDAFRLRGNASIYVTPEENVPQEGLFLKWYLSPQVQSVIESETYPRPEMMQIDFRVMVSQHQNAMSASAQAMSEVSKTFGKISKNFPSAKEQIEEILRLHEKIGALSSRGLIVGLINCLPPTQRGALFKINDINEKIKTLKKELTDEMVEKNFKGDGERTVKSKIKELEKVMSREDRMIELALYLFYESQGRNLVAIEKILRPENRAEFAEFLTQQFSKTLGDKDTKRFRELVLTNFKDVFGEVTEGKVEMWTQKAAYTLVEVPPTIAIHRGCLNGDCFSKFAFGFAYAPGERTFVLRNDKGENILAVYGMAVQYNGRTALYIHEIGSPNANNEIVEWVARTLYENRRELGYEEILITAKSMHWQYFQQYLHQFTDRRAVRFTITDVKSRILIGDKMVEQMGPRLRSYGYANPSYAKEHDVATAHTQAYLFAPPNPAYRIDSRVNPGPDFQTLLGMVSQRLRRCSHLFE